MKSDKAILLIMPNWLGDMVMAQPLLQLLKQQHNCALDVVAPAWSQGLIERIKEIRQGYKLNCSHGELALRQRWQLAQILRANNYQRAYVLPNSLKSALIPAFAGIGRRVGWRGEWRFYWLNDIRLLSKRRYRLMYQRYAALAFPYDFGLSQAHIPYPKLSSKPEHSTTVCKQLGLELNRQILAIAPGAAYGPSKRWPLEYFVELSIWACQQGWQVLCLGSESEAELGRAWLQALSAAQRGQCRNLCGQTSLPQVIDLLAVVDKLVANDSGLMHVYCALGKAPVVFYGPTDCEHTPPLHPQAQIIQNESLHCRPCHQRECPLKHHKCMRSIEPQQVMSLLNTMS